MAGPSNNVAPVQFLGKRQTAGYQPAVMGSGWTSFIDGRPRFSLSQVPRMLDDPQVQFTLRILRSPLASVQFKIASANSQVAKFVEIQAKKIWQKSIAKLAGFFEYGYAAGEVTYSTEQGLIVFDAFHDVHPLDAKPLQFRGGPQHGQVAGVRVRSSAGQSGVSPGDGGREGDGQEKTAAGVVDLMPPHAFWFAGETRYGSLFGTPRLKGMFEPWLEKSGRNGAKQSRQQWYHKNAYRGGMMRYPDGVTDFGDASTGPQLRNNQDIAREIVEKFENGGVLTLPNDRDVNGDYKWTFEPPATHGDAAGLRDYPKDLDREILIGGGVPPELVEASTVGSGYSGRAIPAQVFFTSMDEVVSLLADAINNQIIAWLVRVNFGKVRYDIRPVSLAEKVMEDPEKAKQMLGAGGGGQDGGQDGENGQGGAGGQGGSGPQPPQPPQGQRPAISLAFDKNLDKSLTQRIRQLADAAYPDLGPVQLGWAPAQTRSGSVKAVGTGRDTGRTLYGVAAERALRTLPQTGTEAVSARDRRANADTARETLNRLIADPSAVSREQLNSLAENISALTVEQLREARRQLGARFGTGARRDRMVQAIRERVRAMTPAAPPSRAEQSQGAAGQTGQATAPQAQPQPIASAAEIANRVTSRSFSSAAEIASALSGLSLANQFQVRILSGLPQDPQRTVLAATDPAAYTVALAGALFNASQGRPPASTPPVANPPPPRSDFQPPSIEGTAAGRPTPPSNVRLSVAAETKPRIRAVFGKDLDEATLLSMGNAFQGGSVTVSHSGDTIEIRSRGPNGEYASRSFYRKNGKLECRNNYFRLVPENSSATSPYERHGLAVFLNQVRGLREAGVQVITTQAAGDRRSLDTRGGYTGYYTWPRFGYSGQIDEAQFDRLPPQIRQAMGNSRDTVDLFQIPGGSDAWKEHGSWIDCTFDLSDNSKNMQALDRYLEKRRQEAREGRQARRA